MKKNKPGFNEKKWRSEFEEFQNTDHSSLPKPELSMHICETVKRELSPGFSKVLSQLILIQIVAGSMTLAICPQFGIGPIGGGNGIVSYIEHFGPLVCGAFCGSFFLFFAAIVAGLFLTRPESLMTRESAQHHSPDLSFITMWLIAGILMGSAAFTLTSKLKN